MVAVAAAGGSGSMKKARLARNQTQIGRDARRRELPLGQGSEKGRDDGRSISARAAENTAKPACRRGVLTPVSHRRCDSLPFGPLASRWPDE